MGQVVGLGTWFFAPLGGPRTFQGADPTKANTDGDATNDYREVLSGTNPTLKGFKVTISLSYLKFNSGETDDGDPGFSTTANTGLLAAGDINLVAWVQRPDDGAPLGLGAEQNFFNLGATQFSNSTAVGEGAVKTFGGPRSTTFELGLSQTFAFGSLLEELDLTDTDSTDKMQVRMGGMDGLQVSVAGAKQTAVFSGFDLDSLFTSDLQRSVTKELVFEFTKEDNTSPNQFKTNPNDKMAGKLVFSMTVYR